MRGMSSLKIEVQKLIVAFLSFAKPPKKELFPLLAGVFAFCVWPTYSVLPLVHPHEYIAKRCRHSNSHNVLVILKIIIYGHMFLSTLILCLNPGSITLGPQDACGPPVYIIGPATTFVN